jgi:thiosulfate dehydrogenase (quinone) large subunit
VFTLYFPARTAKICAMSATIETQNERALAFLRIAVGLLFLIFGQYKVFSTYFTLHGGFQFWIYRFLENNSAYPFMVPVLRGFVLPHATPIAFLVAYGELAIGLALVLGVLVRYASCAGLIFMLTLLFSSNHPGPDAHFWEYFGASLDHSVLALCFATFLIGRADSVWSITSLWSRRSGGNMTDQIYAGKSPGV